MKKALNAGALVSVLISLAIVQTTGQVVTPAKPSVEPTLVKFQDLKWEKGGLPCNSEITFLRIDPVTQATDLMIRNPAKCYIPRHWHTANERIYILSGIFVLECEGKREELGPGSLAYVPSKMLHRAWTKPDEGAVYFIHVDRAWDMNYAEDPGQPPWAQ